MKIVDLTICNRGCGERNSETKLCEMKEEVKNGNIKILN